MAPEASSFNPTVGSVGVVLGVLHDDHEGQPCLFSGRDDLVSRQEETTTAIGTGMQRSQLKGVGVLDALVIAPVNGVTTSLV